MAIKGNHSVVFGRISRGYVVEEHESMAQVVETREILENEKITEL